MKQFFKKNLKPILSNPYKASDPILYGSYDMGHMINHMVKLDYLKRQSQGIFSFVHYSVKMSKSLSRTFNLELIFSELFQFVLQPKLTLKRRNSRDDNPISVLVSPNFILNLDENLLLTPIWRQKFVIDDKVWVKLWSWLAYISGEGEIRVRVKIQDKVKSGLGNST